MEFFRNPNIDFLGKKWYFLAFSLVFSVAGFFSMLFWHGIPYGVDFRGGTLVYVKFSHTPDDNAMRAAMDRAGLHNAKIQRYGQVFEQRGADRSRRAGDQRASPRHGKLQIIKTLQTNAPGGQDRISTTPVRSAIKNYLMDKDPMHLGTDADQKYTAQAQAVVDYSR